MLSLLLLIVLTVSTRPIDSITIYVDGTAVVHIDGSSRIKQSIGDVTTYLQVVWVHPFTHLKLQNLLTIKQVASQSLCRPKPLRTFPPLLTVGMDNTRTTRPYIRSSTETIAETSAMSSWTQVVITSTLPTQQHSCSPLCHDLCSRSGKGPSPPRVWAEETWRRSRYHMIDTLVVFVCLFPDVLFSARVNTPWRWV